MNDISKENFGQEKVNLHSFLYIFGFVVYIMLWALTLIHFTQGVGIYFEKLYFFVMWLILSLLSAIVKTSFSRYDKNKKKFYDGNGIYQLKKSDDQWKIFSLMPFQSVETL